MSNNAAAVVSTVIERVGGIFAADGSGHDIEHVMRVYLLAKHIAEAEGADVFQVSLAALLHDAGDYKLTGTGSEDHRGAVSRVLDGLNVEPEMLEAVIAIIEKVSFKGNAVADTVMSLEGRCVRDADRLDAMGAIGVARTFAYGALYKRPMYNPSFLPQQHSNFEDYKKNKGPTLNHFYEKLLLLKDRMETPTGQKMAVKRHAFLEAFLREFLEDYDLK